MQEPTYSINTPYFISTTLRGNINVGIRVKAKCICRDTRTLSSVVALPKGRPIVQLCSICIRDKMYIPDQNRRSTKGSMVCLLMSCVIIPDIARIFAIMTDYCNVTYREYTCVRSGLQFINYDVPHCSLWKGLHYDEAAILQR